MSKIKWQFTRREFNATNWQQEVRNRLQEFSSTNSPQVSLNRDYSSVHSPQVALTRDYSPVNSQQAALNRLSLQQQLQRPQTNQEKEIMTEDLYYVMKKTRVGNAVIINNLHSEQTPTQMDVEAMATVLKDIGFDVEIHRDLTSQSMNSIKRKITTEAMHKDSNCFLLLVISHGTADNFLLDKDGNKTWNIESLVTEICDVQSLVGKPKLFFIEACRGKEQNQGTVLMTKSMAPPPQPSGVTLPNKQDVFVGFATVPGYVSLTSSGGSPYLQALAGELATHGKSRDLSEIHLLVKRKLAGMKLGSIGVTQGAEERSSLLSKLLFTRYTGSHKGTLKDDLNGGKSWFSRSSNSGVMKSRSSPLFESRAGSSASTEPSQTPITNPQKTSFEKPIEVTPRRNLILKDRPKSQIFSRSSPKLSARPRLFSMESERESSEFRQSPRFFQESMTKSTEFYTIEVNSSDVEGGLNSLLKKIIEIYGGEGKVKTKKKNKNKVFSFKYQGPSKATSLLESALKKVSDLQEKSTLWKFTQNLEITTIR